MPHAEQVAFSKTTTVHQVKQHGRSDASSHTDLILLRKTLSSATGGSLKRHWGLTPAAENVHDLARRAVYSIAPQAAI